MQRIFWVLVLFVCIFAVGCKKDSPTSSSGEVGLAAPEHVSAAPEDARRELYDAMRQVAETGKGPAEQVASMGCSIKWKAA